MQTTSSPTPPTLKGTIRTYDPKVRAFIHQRVPEICNAVAAVYRATADAHIIEGCPAVITDGTVSEPVRETLTGIFGKAVIDPANIPKLGGSEDFSFVTERIPGLMTAISAGSPDEGYQFSHTTQKRSSTRRFCPKVPPPMPLPPWAGSQKVRKLRRWYL